MGSWRVLPDIGKAFVCRGDLRIGFLYFFRAHTIGQAADDNCRRNPGPLNTWIAVM
jgi:hypothetical protein